MKKRLSNLFATIALFALIINSTCLAAFGQHQRPRRAKDASSEFLPSGSRVLPKGYVLILRLESQLSSGVNRPGDRFIARVHEAVTDESGSMVLPANLQVNGHVSEVSPAQMRRRSGLISIAFDNILMPNGREIPLRGELTSADAGERRNLKIDEEGNVEGSGSQTKRSTVFIGGGATAGAVIGAIAGGAALGAGIGAAAGVIAVLLAKGKEAVVDPGTLIGVELTEKLDLMQSGATPTRPSPQPTIPNSSSSTNHSTSSNNSTTQNNNNSQPPISPNTQPPIIVEPQLLRLSFVQAERVSGGSILIVATAETPTSNWRVKTEQQINNETLELWVKGTPPEGHAAKTPSHPTVTATVPDAKGTIRRVLIHGAGGDRVINVPLKTGR